MLFGVDIDLDFFKVVIFQYSSVCESHKAFRGNLKTFSFVFLFFFLFFFLELQVFSTIDGENLVFLAVDG